MLVSHQHLLYFLFQLTLSKVTQLFPNWIPSPQHLNAFLLKQQKINALPHAVSACLAVPGAAWCSASPGFSLALPWDIISQWSTDPVHAGQLHPAMLLQKEKVGVGPGFGGL